MKSGIRTKQPNRQALRLCSWERARGKKRGQAVVEFALVVPIFVVLIIGILEFGWYTKNLMTLSAATREATRVASIGKTQAEILARANRYGSPLVFTTASPGNSLSPDQCDQSRRTNQQTYCTMISMQQCDSTGANCTAMPADTGGTTPQNGVRPPNMVRVVLTILYPSLSKMIPGMHNRVISSTVTLRREA